VIRLLDADDAEELAALYLANRDFLRPFEPARDEAFFTVERQRERIEQSLEGDRWMWAIVADGTIAGLIALNDVLRGALQLANVGYWVDRSHTGRGLASAALAEVVDFAFGEAQLHRLEAGTQPGNLASQRVLERNGFEKFGYARKLLLVEGEWRDHVLFERVADG
jgi:[ribosomal protein S5]-alanine N-acetyltransferase